MSTKIYTFAVSTIFLSIVLIFADGIEKTQAIKASKIDQAHANKMKGELIKPIPTAEEYFDDNDLEYSEEVIKLGRKLFHDPRLSSDGSLSCASCHDLRYGGIDRSATSMGIHGQPGSVNTPTIFNITLGVSAMWDGRSVIEDLDEKSTLVIDSNWQAVLKQIKADKLYVKAFMEAMPDYIDSKDDIKPEHIMLAISDFERTLLTPNSPFDRYLKGDVDAISKDEIKGYELFRDKGCIECHYGPAIGEKTHQKLGKRKSYFGSKDTINHIDRGRFNVTKRKKDLYVFKVPTLRNIELTGPYFHDGSVKTLKHAVELMVDHQLEEEVSDKEIDLIVKFLKTLNGEYNGKPLKSMQNTSDFPAKSKNN